MVITPEERIYAVIQSLVVIGGIIDVNWFFFGIEKFKLTVIRNSIIKLLSVASVFVFVHSKDDLWLYILIMALTHLLPNIVILFFLPRYVRYEKVSIKHCIRHIIPLLVLFIPVIAVSIYRTMDKIMLGLMSSIGEVGLYENADKIIRLPLGLITAVGTVMLPFISNSYAKKEFEKAKRYLDQSMELVMIFAFALTFGIASVSPEFAPVFWGNEFLRCSALIQIGVVALPFLAFADVLRTQYLIPLNRDIVFTVSVCAGAVSNVIVNALLIPDYGAMGASIATVVSEIVVCSVQVFAVRRELPFSNYIRKCLPFVFFGMLMYAAVRMVGQLLGIHIYTLFAEIVFGCIVYLLCVAFYARMTKDQTIIYFVHSNEILNKLDFIFEKNGGRAR
jgi:O-antigen/teichoic acid export membrane protein